MLSRPVDNRGRAANITRQGLQESFSSITALVNGIIAKVGRGLRSLLWSWERFCGGSRLKGMDIYPVWCGVP